MTETAKKPIVAPFSFDEIGTTEYTLLVDDVDRVLEFQMVTISGYEWQEIGLSVPSPTVPIMGTDPVTKRPMPDRNNPDYLIAMQFAETERNYRRLARCLKIEIPGKTLAEKAAYLKENLPSRLYFQLAGKMIELAVTGEVEIEMRANSFRVNGSGNHAGALASEDDGSTVERAQQA